MKKKIRKILACFMAALLLTAGCGKQDAKDNGSDTQESAMGRYAETETDLSGQIEDVTGIFRVSGEKLVLVNMQGDMLTSKDGGVTWESGNVQWIKETAAASYIMDVKMAPDGTFGVVYMEKEAGTEGAYQEPECALLLPDGNPVSVKLPDIKEGVSVDRIWISDKGRYFVTTTGEEIYEVQEDGSSQLYLTAQGSPQTILFQGNFMWMDGYDFKEPLLYDMDAETYIEDEVLAEFVRENYGERGFNGRNWHNLCVFPGEDGVVYLAGKNGLHRHVIGGSMIEQVIAGELSRLGNPHYGIADMVFLENGEFLAVSGNGKLLSFVYDADMKAVPEEKLKVYSLVRSSDVQTAVSTYQIQHPDVFVEYTAGMEEAGAVTRDDAIKKLNTQIMAGEGPDILVLDGLPIDSYIEKGLLCDLSGCIQSMEQGELFENLLYAFGETDKVYAVPGQFSLPVMMGREKEISGGMELREMADAMEKMRAGNAGTDLLGLCSEKAIMKFFGIISAGDWIKENGEVDRDAVAEFLIQSKRIYEAQMDGIDEQNIDRFLQVSGYNVQEAGENWMYDLSYYGFSMDYAAGYFRNFVGVSRSPEDYVYYTSIPKAQGFEDTALMAVEKDAGGVFIPETILGINAASAKKELAEDFMRMFFAKENQVNVSGYPINKKALDALLVPDADKLGENGEYGMFGTVDEEGTTSYLSVYFPEEEECAALQAWLESVSTPYIENPYFEECVFEEGSAFILGEREIGETLDAIEKSLNIYMAE